MVFSDPFFSENRIGNTGNKRQPHRRSTAYLGSTLALLLAGMNSFAVTTTEEPRRNIRVPRVTTKWNNRHYS